MQIPITGEAEIGQKEGFAKVSWILFIHKHCSIRKTGYFLLINSPTGTNIDVNIFKGKILNSACDVKGFFSLLGCEIRVRYYSKIICGTPLANYYTVTIIYNQENNKRSP